MREELVTNLRRAGNVLALHSGLQRAAAEFGFPWVTFALRFSTPEGPEHFSLSNYPLEWRREYDAREYIKIDPVLQASLLSLSSLFWDDLKLHQKLEREFMAAAAGHGLVHGLTMPIYGPEGEIGLLSLSREHPIQRAAEYRDQLRIQGTALAWTAYEASLNILARGTGRPSVLSLTAQELECLGNACIGSIPAETENKGAKQAYLLMSAVRKLGVNNRDEALAAVTALGLMPNPAAPPPSPAEEPPWLH